MPPSSRRWRQHPLTEESRRVSWLFTSRCICFCRCRGAREETRTNDPVLFELLMENRLPREIQPLAAKQGSDLPELAGDFFAARGGLFQLLCGLEIGQGFVPSIEPHQRTGHGQRDLRLLGGR